jgi:hypothetical protein
MDDQHMELAAQLLQLTALAQVRVEEHQLAEQATRLAMEVDTDRAQRLRRLRDNLLVQASVLEEAHLEVMDTQTRRRIHMEDAVWRKEGVAMQWLAARNRTCSPIASC